MCAVSNASGSCKSSMIGSDVTSEKSAIAAFAMDVVAVDAAEMRKAIAALLNMFYVRLLLL